VVLTDPTVVRSGRKMDKENEIFAMISIGRMLSNWLPKLLFLLSIAAPHTVAAEIGACGLEAGMWGKSAAVCALADRPEEAERQFGDSALLRWATGIWVFQGVTCGIFSSEVNGSTCTVRFECGRAMGTTKLEFNSAREMNWGKPGDPPWVYCGKREPSK
jgi:hypothetical protein